jgi:hypothetical protein
MVCGLIPPSRFPQPDDPTKSRSNEDFFLNSSGIFGFVALITLFMAYMGTYFIPTFLHVSQHFFKRPLAIVVPRIQPSQEADESVMHALVPVLLVDHFPIEPKIS